MEGGTSFVCCVRAGVVSHKVQGAAKRWWAVARKTAGGRVKRPRIVAQKMADGCVKNRSYSVLVLRRCASRYSKKSSGERFSRKSLKSFTAASSLNGVL